MVRKGVSKTSCPEKGVNFTGDQVGFLSNEGILWTLSRKMLTVIKIIYTIYSALNMGQAQR